MSGVGHQLLFLMSVSGLVGASFRLASRTGAAGLERAVATTVTAAALAICEAMVLGLAGLGSSPVALTTAALSTYGATLLLRTPQLGALEELHAWYRASDRSTLVVVGLLGGTAAAWAAWNLYRPDIGIDGIAYHFPEIAGWISSGHVGAVQQIHPWLHIGDYPLAHDVLLAWTFGISRSPVPEALMSILLLLVAVAAGLAGLRALGVPRLVRALATGAVCTVPVAVGVVDGPLNDVAAVAWLIAAGGLAAASLKNPRLLAPTVIAAGLAIGTKTTALPLAALLVVVMLVKMRASLRDMWPALVVAGIAVFVIGGFWYLRDLVEHGSPFWPFAATSWGDPVPPPLETFHSFLARPKATIDGNLGTYGAYMSGALVLLLSAFAAPLWERSRAVVAGAALTVASVLIWASAPTSGISDYPDLSASVSQTRYLLPAAAVAASTIALTARRSGRGRQIATILLAAALAWNLGQIGTGVFPQAFSKWWLVGGAGIGALVGIALARSRSMVEESGSVRPRWVPLAAAGTVGVVAAAGLTAASSGYTSRYADHTPYLDAPLVRWFDANDRGDSRPIFMAPLVFGPLVGDHFGRTVHLIGARTPCATVKSRLQRAWVVLSANPLYRKAIGYTAGRCLTGVEPSARVGHTYRIYQPRE